MNTQPTLTSTPVTTPRVSFTAYPLGAWLVCIVGACLFFVLSHHEERVAIVQILIATSMAVATVGGTMYALFLLALKRYPSFKASFFSGVVVSGICVAAAAVINQPKLSFAMIALFLLISAILPLFARKQQTAE